MFECDWFYSRTRTPWRCFRRRSGRSLAVLLLFLARETRTGRTQRARTQWHFRARRWDPVGRLRFCSRCRPDDDKSRAGKSRTPGRRYCRWPSFCTVIRGIFKRTPPATALIPSLRTSGPRGAYRNGPDDVRASGSTDLCCPSATLGKTGRSTFRKGGRHTRLFTHGGVTVTRLRVLATDILRHGRERVLTVFVATTGVCTTPHVTSRAPLLWYIVIVVTVSFHTRNDIITVLIQS